MRKKIKLFSSIATLCLLLAAMTFCVYAMGESSIDIDASITFSVSDVYAKIEIAKFATPSSVDYSDELWDTIDSNAIITRKTYTENEDGIMSAVDSSEDIDIGDVNIDGTNNKAWILIKITNMSSIIPLTVTISNDSFSNMANVSKIDATNIDMMVGDSMCTVGQSDEIFFYASRSIEHATVEFFQEPFWSATFTLTKDII